MVFSWKYECVGCNWAVRLDEELVGPLEITLTRNRGQPAQMAGHEGRPRTLPGAEKGSRFNIADALTTICQSCTSEPICSFSQRISIAYGLNFTGWTFFRILNLTITRRVALFVCFFIRFSKLKGHYVAQAQVNLAMQQPWIKCEGRFARKPRPPEILGS